MGRLSERRSPREEVDKVKERLEEKPVDTTYDNEPPVDIPPEPKGLLGGLMDRMLPPKPLKERPITREDIYEGVRATESKGAFGLRRDIINRPIPKGVCEEIICGEPIDFHDLEDFTINISPHKFENLLKIKEAIVREEEKNYRIPASQKGFSGNMKWIILALLLGGVGIVMVLFLPQIMQGLSGMMGGFGM